MKQMPMIEKFMSNMPHTIGYNMPIKTALDLMREQHIRHLPVENSGKLVGVISDRDIKLASAFNGNESMTIEDIMTNDPYTVEPHTPVDDVVLNMAEHKYGCAIIKQANGKVVGIFTATDGLRVLGEVLQGNFKPIQA